MYENRIITKTTIKNEYPFTKGRVDHYYQIYNGLKPWYEMPVKNGYGKEKRLGIFLKQAKQTYKECVLKSWAIYGNWSIITDGTEKYVFQCYSFLLSKSLAVSIDYGEIAFFKPDLTQPYYSRYGLNRKTKKINKLTQNELKSILELCADNADFPKIERIVRRYIRMQIKQYLTD